MRDTLSLLVFITLYNMRAQNHKYDQIVAGGQLDVLCLQKGLQNLENTSRAGTTTHMILHASWSTRMTVSNPTPLPNCTKWDKMNSKEILKKIFTGLET